MKNAITAVHDEKEIQISGTSRTLSDLGQRLCRFEAGFMLKTTLATSPYYPNTIKLLQFNLTHAEKLSLSLQNDILIFSGGQSAFSMLGESLQNFFDEETKAGHHIHLDYFGNADMLEKTLFEMIITCEDS